MALVVPTVMEVPRACQGRAILFGLTLLLRHWTGAQQARPRPKSSTGKVPVLFFVGWLSCDSIENPQGEPDGSALIIRLIEQSGYRTVRTEKPGAGDSQGTPCDEAAFQSELEGYQAAFDSMNKYEFLASIRSS